MLSWISTPSRLHQSLQGSGCCSTGQDLWVPTGSGVWGLGLGLGLVGTCFLSQVSSLKSELRAQPVAWSLVICVLPPSAAELCHTSLAQSPARGFGWRVRVMSAGLKLCSPLFISISLWPFLGPNTSLLATAESFPGLSYPKVARLAWGFMLVQESVCKCGRGCEGETVCECSGESVSV